MRRRSFFATVGSSAGLFALAAGPASAQSAIQVRSVPSFGEVQHLLSDRTLTLGVNVGEGAYLEAGGFRYLVAAQGANDWHVKTAGGVPLYVLRNYDGEIPADAWGAVGDGRPGVVGHGTDNAEVFARLLDYAISLPGRPPAIRFSSGSVYAYSESPNWARRPWLKLRGDNTTFRNIGDGHSVVFDAGGTPGPTGRSFGNEFTGFMIEGHRNSGHGMFMRSCHHARVDAEVRGCGTESNAFHLVFTVLCRLPLVASINRGAWYDGGRPKIGIYCDGRAAPEVGLNEGVTTCTFPDIMIEGCSGHGVYLEHATQCRFVGGTSEGNDGPNFECGPRSQHNVIDALALEVTKAGKGFIDRSRSNRWLNLYNDADGHLTEESSRSVVTGGRHDSLTDDGTHNHFLHTEVGLAGGRRHLNGSDHFSHRVYRITTASYLPDVQPMPEVEPTLLERVSRRVRGYLPW